jgi:uncharacterized protein
MEIFSKLLPILPEGKVLGVQIGLFWTAVLVEVDGKHSCGLASTHNNPEYEHARFPAVREPGKLESYSGRQLADLVHSESLTEVAVGLAAINALLPRPNNYVELPADEYIARQGSDSRVAVIGHFPFVDSLRLKVRDLWVLELKPTEGDLPASVEPDIIPMADILAITSTTLINRTFDEVFRHRKPGAKVMLLGPSTPLAPCLFELGIHVLSGSIVDRPENVFAVIRQAANFRQVKSQGVRLVTLEKNESK